MSIQSELAAKYAEVKARLWGTPTKELGFGYTTEKHTQLWHTRDVVVPIVIPIKDEAADRVQEIRELRARLRRQQKIIEAFNAGGVTCKVSVILKLVCDTYSMSRLDIMSDRRTANVVRPRQVIMYLSVMYSLRSLPVIGRKLGGKDHTTVLHGYRKIKGLRPSDRALDAELTQFERALGVLQEPSLPELPTVPA